MDLDRAKASYERDGVAQIPGVFTKDETDFIRAEAITSLEGAHPDKPYRSGQRLQTRTVTHGSVTAWFPSILFWPALGKGYLDGVRTDPRMQEIVQHFLGPDVKQLNNQVYYRMPGDGDAFNWHQDVMFRKGLADGHSIAEDYLQTVIVVDEQDGNNGALLFKVGSHRLGDRKLVEKAHLRDAPDLRDGGLPAEAPEIWRIRAHSGDVLIWSVMSIHGSLPNTSSGPRMTYMNGFCCARSSEAWPWYLKAGQIQPADPEAIPYT